MTDNDSDVEAAPVLLNKYVDSTEVEAEKEDGEWVVTNHDELEQETVVRGMNREEAEEYNLDILTPERPSWREEFANIDLGEEVSL